MQAFIWPTIGDEPIIIAEGQTLNIWPVTTEPPVLASLVDGHFTIWNQGDPDDYGNGKWNPRPFYFARIELEIPGRMILNGAFQGVQQDPNTGRFILVREDDYKQEHPRADTDPTYAESRYRHFIDGGSRFYTRFVPPDHFEEPYPTAVQQDAVRSWLHIDSALLTEPRMRALLDCYTIDVSSFMPTPKKKNWGWWMFADHFVSIWTSRAVEEVSGWYGGATDIQSPGDKFSNGHYDHLLFFFLKYLIDGDQLAYLIGMYLVRYRIAHGLVDVPNRTIIGKGGCQNNKAWLGEKGERRGVLGVMQTKQWACSTIVAHMLCPSDPLIARGYEVARERLLEIDNGGVWNGAGGGRAVGNYLRDALHFYRATGKTDTALVARITSFIDHVFVKVGTNNWFPNSLRPGFMAAWEEATAYIYTYLWMKEGVGSIHLDKLTQMIEFLVTKAGRFVRTNEYLVAYEIDLPNAVAPNITHPCHQCWWIPLWPIVEELWPGRFANEIAASRATLVRRIGQGMGNVIANSPPMDPTKIDTRNVGEGSAWEKWIPSILWSVVY